METQTENDVFVMNFFKSLTQVDRLKIAGALAIHDYTLDELSTHLHMPARQVFNHLENLTRAGILRCEGKTYALDAHALEAMARKALAGQRPQVSEDDFEGDDYERKVLADFMTPEGMLRSIPAQFKKLMVVLRHIANQSFEADVRYPEKQVNTILSHYNEDTASLRRYMVDTGLLAREKGVYWKLENSTP